MVIEMGRSKYKVKLMNAIVASVITLIISVICMLCFGICFNSDDVAFKNILSGAYTGKPEAHVYFIMYPLAWIIKELYVLFPQINVYYIFLLGGYIIALFLITFRILEKGKNAYEKLCYLIVVYLLSYRMLVYIHWTTTAAMLCGMAMFWYGTKNEKIQWVEIVPIILAFVVAFNLRSMIFFMFFPFIILLVVGRNYDMLRNGEKKATYSDISIILIVVVLCLVCLLTHKVVYHTDAWKEADDFSTYRSDLNDKYGYPRYDNNVEFYEKLGIDQATFESLAYDYDYLIFINSSIDSKVLSIIADKAEELYRAGEINSLVRPNFPGYTEELYALSKSPFERILYCIKDCFEDMFSETYRLYTCFIFIAVLSICAYYWEKLDYYKLCITVCSFLGLVFIWIILLYTGRLPSHVVYSLYICELMFLLANMFQDNFWDAIFTLNGRKTLGLLFIIYVGIGLNISMSSDMVAEKNELKHISEIKQLVYDYADEHKGNIYIRDILSLNYFESYNNQTGGNVIPYVTWLSQFPIKCQYLDFDSDDNFGTWLSKKDNVYLIVRSDRAEAVCDRKKRLLATMNTDCELVKVDEIISSKGTKEYVYHFVCTGTRAKN